MVGQSGPAVAGAFGTGRSYRAFHARTCANRHLVQHARSSPSGDKISSRTDNSSSQCHRLRRGGNEGGYRAARLLIQPAEERGETLDDPLLLLSVLFGV